MITASVMKGLIDTWLYRGFIEKFHQEINILKSVIKNNGYPKKLIDSCIKKFLDKLFVKNGVSLTVPKLQLVCALPCTGKSSFDLRVRVRHTTEKDIRFCELKGTLGADLKISLHILSHVKIIPWKLHILNRKNSRVIYP